MYKTTEALRNQVEELEKKNKQLNLLLDERNEEVQAAIARKKAMLFTLPKEVGEWIDSLPLEELFDDWYNNTNDLPTVVREYFSNLEIPGGVHNITDVYNVITERIARSKLDGYLIEEIISYHLINKITGNMLVYNKDTKRYKEISPFFEDTKNYVTEFTDDDVAGLDVSSYEREEVKD